MTRNISLFIIFTLTLVSKEELIVTLIFQDQWLFGSCFGKAQKEIDMQ